MATSTTTATFPTSFALAAQSDERIDFTVTAHYSYPYPRRDETEEERDRRLETRYEYTRTYPVTLVNTDAGWRFDAFTTPNQADMRLLGANGRAWKRLIFMAETPLASRQASM